jgi:fructose-bisphosphate aldolase class II
MEIASKQDCIIGGFNVYGVDDSKAIIEAAEELRAPVILMINELATSILSIECWADVLNTLAKRAGVPVCIHLDHAKDESVIERASVSGYDSIMFDGSRFPFEKNVEVTKRMTNYIHAHGLIAEAEIGFVCYSDKGPDNNDGIMTDPKEAAIFVEETRADWIAVSVGNVHRMEKQNTKIDFERLKVIEQSVSVPLVIHGFTGITDADTKKMMKTSIAKANIGTALRMAFGKTLRDEVIKNPDVFDRVALLNKPIEIVKQTAKKKMQILGLEGFFD